MIKYTPPKHSSLITHNSKEVYETLKVSQTLCEPCTTQNHSALSTHNSLVFLIFLSSFFYLIEKSWDSPQQNWQAALHQVGENDTQMDVYRQSSVREQRKELRAKLKEWRQNRTNINERGLKQAIWILLVLIALATLVTIAALFFFIYLLAALISSGVAGVSVATWALGITSFGILIAVGIGLWRVIKK